MHSVLYLGPPHSFHHLAAQCYFGEGASYTAVKEPEDIGRMLNEGTYTHGVIAVENVQAGRVPRHLEIIEGMDLFICGQLIMEVNLFVCGVAGATIDGIETVYSHPMALLQSSSYLAGKQWKQVDMSSTTEALLHISEAGNSAWSAIGNRTSAALFSLSILDGPVNNARDNHTRFLVVQPRNKIAPDTTHTAEFTSLLVEAQAIAATREKVIAAGYSVFREWPLEDSGKVMLELQAVGEGNTALAQQGLLLNGQYAAAKYCLEH
jgi:prephenate dehydratase